MSEDAEIAEEIERESLKKEFPEPNPFSWCQCGCCADCYPEE